MVDEALLNCPYCARSLDCRALPVVATSYTARTLASQLAPPAAPRSFLEADLEPSGDFSEMQPKSGAAAVGHLGRYPILWQPTTQDMRRQVLQPVWDHGSPIDRPARACPHCLEALPPEAGFARIHTFGIVGTPSAGKSHFIAACLRLADESQGLRPFGIEDFRPTERTEQILQQEYRRVLEIEHSVLPKTNPGNKTNVRFQPLTFKAEMGGAERLFMFHDVAGEQLLDAGMRDETLPFLRNVAGMIFLLDAWGFRSVREEIGHLEGADNSPLEINQVRLIRALADDYESIDNRLATLPIAFAINKSDLIFRAFGRINDALHETEAEKPSLRKQQIDTIGRVLAEDLFPMLDGSNLRSAIERFHNYSLHLIATLGYQPANDKVERLSSVRLLDPLISLMENVLVSENPPPSRFRRRR